MHQLEERNADIDIPDKAFEKLFDFFDQYSWHLDERELRAGNEINPDVVGYIFEKYINQKQMAAYYTKEDITEYISKNTIIPFLFDAAEKKCPIAFQKGSFMWRLLSDAPDRYIYAAVSHGVVAEHGQVVPLPKDIEKGVKDVAKRDGWNKAAPAPFALPTETWREHVSRRSRCLEVRQKLKNGEVASVNYLHCEKRLSDAGPFDLIWFEDAKREAVANYLQGADAKPYLPALERATTVIDGFESPLGMELLATVDWLVFEGKIEPTVGALRASLKDWPGGRTAGTRKLKLFDDRLLGLALERLALKH